MKKYIFISFIVIVGLYLSFISPKKEGYRALKNEYSRTLHQIQQAKKNFSLYDEIVKDWQLKKSQYEAAQKILPDEDNSEALFDQIQLIANKNHVNIEINDSYHDPVIKDFYSVRYFGIKVSGQRGDLRLFLDSLSKGETLFEIIDLALFSPRDGTSIYTVEMIGKTYFFIQGKNVTRKYHKANFKALPNLSHWLFPVFISVTCFWLLTMMVLYLLATGGTSLFFKANANRKLHTSLIESLNRIPPSKRIILIVFACVLSALFTVAFIPELLVATEYLRSILNGNSFLSTKIDLKQYIDMCSAASIIGAVYYPIAFLISTAFIIFILKRFNLKRSREINLFYLLFFLCFFIPLFLLVGFFSFDHHQTKNSIPINIIEGFILILSTVISFFAARFTVFMLKGRVNKDGFVFRKKYPLFMFLTSVGLIAAALTGNWLMSASDFEKRGYEYYKAGAYRSAISDLTKAIEMDGARFMAYKLRAMSYYEINHFSEAISDFRTTIKLKPDYKEAYIWSAIASDLNNDIHGAIINYATALHVAPGYSKVHHFKGSLYNCFGLYASAIADLNNTISLEPENVDAITDRANIYFKAGLFKEAHTDYQDLVRLTPSDSTAHLFKFIAAKRAHMDETIALQNYFNSIDEDIWISYVIKMLLSIITPEEMLKIVVENNPGADIHSQGYFYAGQYYLLSGNRERAIKMFEESLQSSKDCETICEITKCELKRYGE